MKIRPGISRSSVAILDLEQDKKRLEALKSAFPTHKLFNERADRLLAIINTSIKTRNTKIFTHRNA